MRRWIVLFVIIAGVLIADQGSKWLVLQNLMIGESYRPIPVLSPLFQLTRSENRGAAFGFLPQAGEVFLLFAFAVVVAMTIFYRRIPDHATLTQVAIALVCGGALGNALDRVQYG